MISTIGRRVVIKPIDLGERKVSNIVLLDNNDKDQWGLGEVVAVGKHEDVSSLFNQGDHLVYTRYGGENIEDDGTELIVIYPESIIAKIQED